MKSGFTNSLRSTGKVLEVVTARQKCRLSLHFILELLQFHVVCASCCTMLATILISISYYMAKYMRSKVSCSRVCALCAACIYIVYCIHVHIYIYVQYYIDINILDIIVSISDIGSGYCKSHQSFAYDCANRSTQQTALILYQKIVIYPGIAHAIDAITYDMNSDIMIRYPIKFGFFT